jgi:hypothetical protein
VVIGWLSAIPFFPQSSSWLVRRWRVVGAVVYYESSFWYSSQSETKSPFPCKRISTKPSQSRLFKMTQMHALSGLVSRV